MGSNPIGRTKVEITMGFLIKKLLLKIASLSKRASAIYCLVLTLVFLVGIALFLTGILYVLPDREMPPFAIVSLAIGSIVILAVLVAVALTTLASNYIGTEGHEEEKKEEETTKS